MKSADRDRRHTASTVVAVHTDRNRCGCGYTALKADVPRPIPILQSHVAAHASVHGQCALDTNIHAGFSALACCARGANATPAHKTSSTLDASPVVDLEVAPAKVIVNASSDPGFDSVGKMSTYCSLFSGLSIRQQMSHVVTEIPYSMLTIALTATGTGPSIKSARR